MKKTVLLFLLLVSLLPLRATHNRSGEILYARITPFSNASGPVNTYSITLITYTDDGPNVADRCVDTLYFGDGSKSSVYRQNGPSNCCGLGIGCGEIIVSDFNYTVKKNIYSIVHTYAGAGSYAVHLSDPNRNNGIVNIPNSGNQPFYIESLIVISANTGKNASPVLDNPPADKGYAGDCFNHNPAAYDVDGDSLSYELAPCKGENGLDVPGYTYPDVGPGGTFGIDNLTGLLTWCNPQALGQYNVVVKIKEWRKFACGGPYQLMGYITRDMQIVINGGAQPMHVPYVITDTCVIAGTTLNKSFQKMSPYASVKLFGSCLYNSATPATISPTLGVANPTVTWITDYSKIRQQPYQVNIANEFYGQTTGNTHDYQVFNVHVVPPSVQMNSITRDTNKVILHWHTSTCPNVTGYIVYRKAGTDSWVHGACETGAPEPSSGYHPVFIGHVNDSVFTDVYVTNYANGSTINYMVTATTDDCVESFASPAKTISLLVGIKQLQLDPSLVSVYPNPFSNSFEINFDKKINGAVQTSLYALDGKLVYKGSEMPGDKTLSIQPQSLEAGVYILQLKTPEGSLYKKLIKN